MKNKSDDSFTTNKGGSFPEHFHIAKKIYDRKTKVDKFKLEDVVLRWDGRIEDKGKHRKFENLWKGPYKIATYRGQNAFLLKEMDGQDCSGGPINGRLLKHYFF